MDQHNWILGIETSCDDTSFALFLNPQDFFYKTVTQNAHKAYNGVVPTIAAAQHLKNTFPSLQAVLAEANLKLTDIKTVAYTAQPGLKSSLLIGKTTAQLVQFFSHANLIPVNHLYAHLYTVWLTTPIQFPCLGIVISGGHTHLYLLDKIDHFILISKTNDDAAGECLDKCAIMLGLTYPGGPAIEQLAATVTASSFKFSIPKTLNPLDFSFSGLKTQFKQYVKTQTSPDKAQLAFGLQKAIIDQIQNRLELALKQYCAIKTVIISGGVAQNIALQTQLKQHFSKYQILFPLSKFAGDNAVMVANYYWQVKNYS